MTQMSTGAPGTGPSTPRPPGEPSTGQRAKGWRTVDVMVTVVIGVAVGVAFLGLSYLYFFIDPLVAAFKPASGLLAGIWFLPAILAGAIVRRPGAALLAELVASFVEMITGGQWGYTTMISGLAQGLGVEVGLAIFGYRRFGWGALAVAGMLASGFEWVYEVTAASAAQYSAAWKAAYLGLMALSGAVISPLVGVPLTRLLARTGVLGSFEAGRRREDDLV